MIKIKSRHIWILVVLLAAFLCPSLGQAQNVSGSNIVSRMMQSSDGLMDNLTLSYDGNRLTGVSETAADYDFTGSFEYKRANGSQYIYNGNGSLIRGRFCDHFLS